jgi:general secretion pathway protein M
MSFQLNKRESIILAIGLIAVLAWILFQFLFSPLADKHKRMKRAITVKESVYKDIKALKHEYDILKADAEIAKTHYSKQDKSFTLFSFLDKLAGQNGIKANITYMKPSTSVSKDLPYKISTVEMKMQGLNLTQLTNYLYGVETSPNNLYIKRLAITKKGIESKSVDVVLQVETIQI